MNYDQQAADLRHAISAAAEYWFYHQSRNLTADYYLHYRPATENQGGALEVEVAPSCGFLPATDNPIPKGATLEQAKRFIRNACKNLPIMPVEPFDLP